MNSQQAVRAGIVQITSVVYFGHRSADLAMPRFRYQQRVAACGSSSVNLKPEQLATLLSRSSNEPRRNLKRYLKDLGGRGSSEELDELLAIANANPKIVKMATKLNEERSAASRTISEAKHDHVRSFGEEIQRQIDDNGTNINELASVCGYSRTVMASIVNGKESPTAEQLARIAIALECKWTLVRE